MAVMHTAAGGACTFNKMSGIQEWRNAVFLFVNIASGGYNNVFLKEFQQMTWFAQPTQVWLPVCSFSSRSVPSWVALLQKPTSRVIERLLGPGKHQPSDL